MIGPYRGSAAWGRVVLLYLASRRFTQTLLAIGALWALTWWVMRQTPTVPIEGLDLGMVTARNETLLLHLAAALLASVIGIAVWSPFGETERVSPVVLPSMRALHLLLMLAIGCVVIGLMIASWPEAIPGVDLVALFVRNALFLTGAVLLAGRFVDVRLAWLLPVVLAGVTVTSLLRRLESIGVPGELWRDNGRNILALDLSHGWATAICLGVAIGGFAVSIRDGVRDAAAGE